MRYRQLLAALLLVVTGFAFGFQSAPVWAQEVAMNGVTLTGDATLATQAPGGTSSVDYEATATMPQVTGIPLQGAGLFFSVAHANFEKV